MNRRYGYPLLGLFFAIYGCGNLAQVPERADASPIVTILFTNDLESAYEPIPTFWRNDIQRIGGAPELTTLIRRMRAQHPNVFLFDSGDHRECAAAIQAGLLTIPELC